MPLRLLPVLCQVCDVEELKDTVTTRLGCDPNFKYFYDSDEDIYNAAPHQYNCTVRLPCTLRTGAKATRRLGMFTHWYLAQPSNGGRQIHQAARLCRL